MKYTIKCLTFDTYYCYKYSSNQIKDNNLYPPQWVNFTTHINKQKLSFTRKHLTHLRKKNLHRKKDFIIIPIL